MLTTEEIKQFITEDIVSTRKMKAKEGQRYYEGDHDILQYKMYYYNSDGILTEDKARSNSKICHPFFTELVDQLSAYIMSFTENPIQAKDTANGLQEHLDVYFDDEFWSEIQELITGCNAKGFEYLYGYTNADNRLAFTCADSIGVVELLAKHTSDKQNHFLYWYVERIEKGQKVIKRIEDHTTDGIYFYIQEDDGEIKFDKNEPINPRPHKVWTDVKGVKYGDNFNFIPFWRLDNNKKQFSGLKPIKGLIDDYDLMECGLSNNLQDFDKPIHLVRGFQGDNLDELQQNIRTKKILGVDETGGLDILTVDIPYQARKTKADEDEKNIYKFGMGFNSVQAGDGNVTNVVIRSRYTLLDLKAGKLIVRLKQFLKDIIKVVLDEINTVNSTDYQLKDVKIEFIPELPTNEQENAQIAQIESQTEQVRINSILNVATVIGEEETLKAICGILDVDFDELKSKLEALNEEQNLANAQTTLDSVVVDDEQTAEAGAETISE